ncbi:unnamed protein product [Cochlearia groenlandica]
METSASFIHLDVPPEIDKERVRSIYFYEVFSHPIKPKKGKDNGVAETLSRRYILLSNLSTTDRNSEIHKELEAPGEKLIGYVHITMSVKKLIYHFYLPHKKKYIEGKTMPNPRLNKIFASPRDLQAQVFIWRPREHLQHIGDTHEPHSIIKDFKDHVHRLNPQAEFVPKERITKSKDDMIVQTYILMRNPNQMRTHGLMRTNNLMRTHILMRGSRSKEPLLDRDLRS